MAMIPLLPDPEALVSSLGRASLDGAIFIALVWAACRLIPRMPASLRSGLWWLATLKLVVGFVWVTPLALPVLPPRQAAVVVTGPDLAMPAPASSAALPSEFMATAAPAPAPRDLPWREGLIVLWLGGLALLGARTVRELMRARRICRAARPVSDPGLQAIFDGLARHLGLTGVALRESDDIDGPHVLGCWRSVVVVPSHDLGRLSASEWEMVLAHELLHLKRGDLFYGLIPFVAERLFFFNPAAVWAAREYKLAREAACDADVVTTLNASPRSYGQMLVALSVPGRSIGAGAIGVMSAHRTLKQRLSMLCHAVDAKRFPRTMRWLMVAVALTGLVPIQLAARDIEPATEKIVAPVESRETTVADILMSEPAPRVDSPTPVAASDDPLEKCTGSCETSTRVETQCKEDQVFAVDVSKVDDTEQGLTKIELSSPVLDLKFQKKLASQIAAIRPRDLTAQTTIALNPMIEWATANANFAVTASNEETPEATESDSDGWTWESESTSDEDPDADSDNTWHGTLYVDRDGDHHYVSDRDFFVLMLRDGNNFMHASSRDLEVAKRLKRKLRGDFLLFRDHGTTYLVRDRELLATAKRAFGPSMELGRRQAELGEQQGKLGEAQGRLGEKQGALGERQAELAEMQADLAEVQAEAAALSAQRRLTREKRRDIERRLDDIRDRMRDLGGRQSELGQRQAELGAKQAELGSRQAALGAKQAELGRQQREASIKAKTELKKIVKRALDKDLAEPVR